MLKSFDTLGTRKGWPAGHQCHTQHGNSAAKSGKQHEIGTARLARLAAPATLMVAEMLAGMLAVGDAIHAIDGHLVHDCNVAQVTAYLRGPGIRCVNALSGWLPG